jgi:hypothetical protein
MNPRERFIAALELQPLKGRVPHFELVFFLTMEAFGKVHPNHRLYDQWLQMEEKEREMHRVGGVDYMTLVENEMTVNRYQIETTRLAAEYHRAVAQLEALVGSPIGGTP